MPPRTRWRSETTRNCAGFGQVLELAAAIERVLDPPLLDFEEIYRTSERAGRGPLGFPHVMTVSEATNDKD
jgi:hypothetical protein